MCSKHVKCKHIFILNIGYRVDYWIHYPVDATEHKTLVPIGNKHLADRKCRACFTRRSMKSKTLNNVRVMLDS